MLLATPNYYQYHITDLLLIVALWPLLLVQFYKYHGSHLDGGMIFVGVLLSAWMGSGWYWSLKVSNGLEYDLFWQRMGVTLLLWMYPAAMIDLFIEGILAVFILTREAQGIDAGYSRAEFFQTILAPFAVSAVWIWFAKRLTARSKAGWLAKEVKYLETRKRELDEKPKRIWES